METVFVLGADGYIGTALTQRLLNKGYFVVAFDSLLRRTVVESNNSRSAIPILSYNQKNKIFNTTGRYKGFTLDPVESPEKFKLKLKKYNPSTIINLAHQPSGPFSMKDMEHSNFTLINNIMMTNILLWLVKECCPDAHYITIGSTGEYSHYANVDIEEGYFKFESKGRMSEECIFPRRPTSCYHTSKVASTYLVDYYSRIWNLHTTDIMQAVVFGAYTDDIDVSKVFTRLDTDECFGTVINRFIVQALLNEPLTIYGQGNHKRGFISLNDSIQALMIAVENKPEAGRTRVWNQLSEWHSINDIAQMVKNVATKFNLTVTTQNLESLRHEYTEDHYYNYVCEILPSLGYKPTRTIEQEVEYCMNILKDLKLKDLKKNVIPKIKF